MLTPSPVLDYAPPPSWFERRRLLIVSTMVGVVLIGSASLGVYLLWNFITQNSHLREWDRACATFTQPPTFIVWQDDAPAALRSASGYATPYYGPFSGSVALYPRPMFWHSLLAGGTNSGMGLALSDREAVLFLHERTSPKGQRRIVAVERAVDYESPNCSFHIFVLERVGFSAVEVGFLRLLFNQSIPAAPGPPLTFYAGQPDPTDPSRFTIEYLVGGIRHTIVGQLQADGRTVTLTNLP